MLSWQRVCLSYVLALIWGSAVWACISLYHAPLWYFETGEGVNAADLRETVQGMGGWGLIALAAVPLVILVGWLRRRG